MKKLALLLTILPLLSYADINHGKDVYEINCANCHSIKMEGGMGKDFNLVSYTRTKKEIVSYITSPSDEYKNFGYTANAMPTIQLNPQDIEDIAEFIDSLQPFKKWMISQNSSNK